MAPTPPPIVAAHKEAAGRNGDPRVRRALDPQEPHRQVGVVGAVALAAAVNAEKKKAPSVAETPDKPLDQSSIRKIKDSVKL